MSDRSLQERKSDARQVKVQLTLAWSVTPLRGKCNRMMVAESDSDEVSLCATLATFTHAHNAQLRMRI